MKHKHIYTERKEGITLTRTSEISTCPVRDKKKCIAWEIKKRKKYD